ncbi:MAG TPA: acyltransferase, partial [Myxococcota bacterium]
MSTRLPALHGLRFVAALWVVANHLLRAWLAEHPDSAALKLVVAAPFAVTVFFVMSGFVLTWAHKDGLDKRRFFAARFSRIIPIYALAVFLALPVGLGARKLGYVHDGYASLMFVATMTQAWVPSAALQWDAPLWSVSVEVAFYLVFPLLLPAVLRAKRSTLVAVAAAGWLGSVAACVLYLVLDPDGIGSIGLDSRGFWLHLLRFNPLLLFPELFIGMVAGRFFVDGARLRLTYAVPIAALLLALFASGV